MRNFDSGSVFSFHRFLLSDETRTRCYEAAIAATVKPGDVVVDIGTGSGILAFFACRSGAKRVYAIESGPVIELAKLAAARNGFADRIEFIDAGSHNIALPEQADVLLTETGGPFGLEGGMLGTLLDGRSRFLKPQGRVLPRSIELFSAPVECPDLSETIELWSPHLYGFDFSAARSFAANSLYASNKRHETVLGPGRSIVRIPFESVADTFVQGQATCPVVRAGVVHALAGWHVTETAAGSTFTNSPIDPTILWMHALMPLDRPQAVQPGDSIRLDISSNDGREWRWAGEFRHSSGEVIATFDQFTLNGFPLIPEELRKLSPHYKPAFSRRGEAVARILELARQGQSAGQMEVELSGAFRDLFPTVFAARRFLHETVEMYSL